MEVNARPRRGKRKSTQDSEFGMRPEGRYRRRNKQHRPRPAPVAPTEWESESASASEQDCSDWEDLLNEVQDPQNLVNGELHKDGDGAALDDPVWPPERPVCALDAIDEEFDALNDSWPFPGPHSVKLFLWLVAHPGITDACLRNLLLILRELDYSKLVEELGGSVTVQKIKALWALLPVQQPEHVEVDQVKIYRNRRSGQVKVYRNKCTLYYFSLIEYAQRLLRNPVLKMHCRWGIADGDGTVREWNQTPLNREFFKWNNPLCFYVKGREFVVGECVRYKSSSQRQVGIGRIAAIT